MDTEICGDGILSCWINKFLKHSFLILCFYNFMQHSFQDGQALFTVKFFLKLYLPIFLFRFQPIFGFYTQWDSFRIYSFETKFHSIHRKSINSTGSLESPRCHSIHSINLSTPGKFKIRVLCNEKIAFYYSQDKMWIRFCF